MATDLAPQSHQHADPAKANADPVKANAPPTAASLGQVQAVRANGIEAVDQIATIVKAHQADWPAIAQWLQQHRGNDFVTQVQAQVHGGPAPKSTKFPIVLVHGFGAGPGSFNEAIPAALKSDGDAVFEVVAPPYESPEERAKAIAPQLEQILQKTGASKLNLVAWSLGGLDARYLISSLGWGDRVASLSMVGTPNHGAAAADKVLSALPAAESALSHLHGLLGKVASIATNTPAKVDPTLSAIDGALQKALHLAQQVHLAPKPDPSKAKEEAPDPLLHGVNKLAGDIASLANQYQNKLPPTVVSGLNTLARRFGGDQGNTMASDADIVAALQALSTKGAADFNAANPDAKGVYYQSWAGVATRSGKKDGKQVGNFAGNPTLNASSLVTKGDNDGAVSVDSAKWGNFRGEIPADHMQMVRGESAADQDRTGFDAAAFYKKMAEDLANRGY